MERQCRVCGRPATTFVSVAVDLVSKTRNRRKFAQFFVCGHCVKGIDELFTRDVDQLDRIAGKVCR